MTSIEVGAFQGSGLQPIDIPDSILSVGAAAFRDCSALAAVSISANLTALSDELFYGCSALLSVVIPDGVNSIGKDVFFGCDSLSSVVIGDSHTSVALQYLFILCLDVLLYAGIIAITHTNISQCNIGSSMLLYI